MVGVQRPGLHWPIATNRRRNTTFGARRDPVDEVVGFRVYPWRNIAFDIGYRSMLNLKGAHDRHGFVIKMGAAVWPEKRVARKSFAECFLFRGQEHGVYFDSGDSVAVSATASDPDNDPLTYTWSSNGGHVDGDGPHVRWLSAGAPVGNYTVTLHVDDGRGGAASCSADIRCRNKNPTVRQRLPVRRTVVSVFAG